MRERSGVDEQERGESVAEFSNGGHAYHSRARSGELASNNHHQKYASVCTIQVLTYLQSIF